MRTKDNPDQSGLEELRTRFMDWRRSPSKSKAIPRELWDAAATAAKRYGAHRVAKVLGVNSQRLREQVGARAANGGGGLTLATPTAPIQVIEMGRLAEMGPSDVPEPMVVELVAADGSRLTIRTRDAGPGVLAMIHAFRGRP